MFQDAAEGILVADIETKRFKYANPAICRMLGYTEKEMERMHVHDIHPKENLEYVLSEFDSQAQMKKTTALLVHELTYECMNVMGGAGMQNRRPLRDRRSCRWN